MNANLRKDYEKLSVIETSGLHLIPLFICRGQLITYFALMLEIAHFF